MFENYLIIVPVHLPWNRPADYQRQTARVLSRRNLVVAYIQEHAHFILKRKRVLCPQMNNVVFFTPHYLFPFRRFAVIDKFNQLLNILFVSVWYGWYSKKVTLWIFDPVFHFYPIARRINPKIISFYDCVDYHWSQKPHERREIRMWEKRLIQSADYFFVNSYSLANIHEAVRKPNAVVPLGFRLDDFLHPLPTKIRFSTGKPVIGYVGALDHRLDFKLLYELVRAHPEWHYILWGPIQELVTRKPFVVRRSLEKLQKMKSVIVGESKDAREIPSIIGQFDVVIVPHDVHLESVRYSYPMKLFEYFYMGKPVVSTPIEELKRFPKFVKIGRSVEEWEAHIKNLLSKPWPKEYQKEQRRLAMENSWEKKIEAISNVIGNA